ncbi:MAG: PIG-L deacetylase family protein [Limimaricola soesokkakensis]|uniref:PIG-L deacetylase family protein n=1 Tax=Limimaricola soesokkakensis TaxID=1343159 RepID=UPI0040597A8D
MRGPRGSSRFTGESPLLWGARLALSATAGELLRDAGGLVVIAAHPGDEILGCAALIHGAGRAGLPVRVICLTRGTAVAALQDDSTALSSLAPEAVLHCFDEREGMLPSGGRPLDLVAAKVAACIPEKAAVLLPWREEAHPDRQRSHAIGRAAMGEAHRALAYPLAGRFQAAAPVPRAMRLLSAPPAAIAAKRRALGLLSTIPLEEIDGDVPPLREHFLTQPEIFILG